MIYPSSQKPPIWSIDPGIIAYNCQKAGMPHPVGAWPMWEGAGGRAFDYSGCVNHGVITGVDWVANGLAFIAANSDNINCGQGSSLNFNGNFSILVTFNTIDVTGTNIMVARSDAGASLNAGNHGYEIGIRDLGGTDRLFSDVAGDDGTASYYAEGDYSDSLWHDIVLVKKDNDHSLYIDGVYDNQVVSAIGNMSAPGETFYIGRDFAGNYYDGNIRNVFAYNRALSAHQIKFLYDNPYFMFQIPEELYGYVTGAPPATYIPALMNYYRQLRTR